MNLKNRKYMRSAEFKARQLWLQFVDAVGIALRVTEEIKERAWAWFKKWSAKTMKDKFDNRTMELDFEKKKNPKLKKKIEKQETENSFPEFFSMKLFGEKLWRAMYTEQKYVIGPDFWNCEYLEFIDITKEIKFLKPQ